MPAYRFRSVEVISSRTNTPVKMNFFIVSLALIACASADVSHLNREYLPPVSVGAYVAGGHSAGGSAGVSAGVAADSGTFVHYAAEQAAPVAVSSYQSAAGQYESQAAPAPAPVQTQQIAVAAVAQPAIQQQQQQQQHYQQQSVEYTPQISFVADSSASAAFTGEQGVVAQYSEHVAPAFSTVEESSQYEQVAAPAYDFNDAAVIPEQSSNGIENTFAYDASAPALHAASSGVETQYGSNGGYVY